MNGTLEKSPAFYEFGFIQQQVSFITAQPKLSQYRFRQTKKNLYPHFITFLYVSELPDSLLVQL